MSDDKEDKGEVEDSGEEEADGEAAAEAEQDAEDDGGDGDGKSDADDGKSGDETAGAKSEAEESDGKPDDGEKPAAKSDKKSKKDKGGGGRWWIILIAVLVVEFYTYGRRGDIEVCVGKQDVHDFSLIGQERTDENRWKFPRCEERVNLGLRSQYDELVEDATNVACRGATLFRNRGEGPQCAKGTDGWTLQVETSYIWPWDSRYYKHLLWFLFE